MRGRSCREAEAKTLHVMAETCIENSRTQNNAANRRSQISLFRSITSNTPLAFV